MTSRQHSLTFAESSKSRSKNQVKLPIFLFLAGNYTRCVFFHVHVTTRFVCAQAFTQLENRGLKKEISTDNSNEPVTYVGC